MNIFCCCCCIFFFVLVLCLFLIIIFLLACFPLFLQWPITASRGFCDKRVSNWFIFPLCMHCLSRYEALRKFREESTSIKSQNDRPSPEIPHENHASL